MTFLQEYYKTNAIKNTIFICLIFLFGFTGKTFGSTVLFSTHSKICMTIISISTSGNNRVTYNSPVACSNFNTLAAPIANTDNATVITGVPVVVNVLSNDIDSDGDALSVTEIIDPDTTVTALTNPGDSTTLSSGTLITLRTDGRLDIVAASDGVETFDYRISDGINSDTSTVTLTAASDEATADSIGFITTWNTTNSGTIANDTIEFLVNFGSSNYTVFWGDGSSSNNLSGNTSHVYASSGIYDITVVGVFAGFAFNGGGDVDKIIDIKQWGNVAFTDWTNGFAGADNLSISSSDNPDLISVTSLQDMFKDVSNFNTNIGGWDVTNITSMDDMLDGTALSIVTYDDILNSWATQTVQSGVTIGVDGLQYSNNASVAVNTLSTTYGWTFEGHTFFQQLPTIVNNSVTVSEGDINTVLTTSDLSATDSDSTDATLSFTVGNVSNGSLTINGSAWASGTNDTFTQQDIIDGNILYTHDDSNTTSDSFSFSVTDGSNTLIGQVFNIIITGSTLSTDNLILSRIKVYIANNKIKIDGIDKGKMEIRLYNILGSQLLYNSFHGSQINNISLSNIKSGVYIVHLKHEIGVLSRKIFIPEN